MKKVYIQPTIQVVELSNEALMMFGSGVNTTDCKGNKEVVSDEPTDGDMEWGTNW